MFGFVCADVVVIVMTVTIIAVPMDAATWRIVFVIATPCGTKLSFNWLSPAVVVGIMTMEIPNIRIAYRIVMVSMEVLMLRLAKNMVLTVNIIKPMTASHFDPYRSNILLVIGDIIPLINAPGRMAIPDSIAENPRMFCIYKGTKVSVPINPINAIIGKITDNVKMGFLKTRNSNIGTCIRSCLMINKVT